MKKLNNMDEILLGKVYYKLRQITLLQVTTGTLLQIATSFITDKLRRPLLQIASGITNRDSTNTLNYDTFVVIRQYVLKTSWTFAEAARSLLVFFLVPVLNQYSRFYFLIHLQQDSVGEVVWGSSRGCDSLD